MPSRGRLVVLAYADCGTYGTLDEVCERLQLELLRGFTVMMCSPEPRRCRSCSAIEPGTFVLADFLVGSFRRTVMSEVGLDRHPELWGDYFGSYRRVVWLAQRWTDVLEAEARGATD